MAATETPTKEQEASRPMTLQQEDSLRNLRIARAIVLRKVTDPDLNKTLAGVPKENGKYRTYYGVSFREVFRSLADTFDSNFKQAEKSSYTKEELKEFFEHFENSMPGFQSHLDDAIEALGRGETPNPPGTKDRENNQEGGKGRGEEKEDKKGVEAENELEHPLKDGGDNGEAEEDEDKEEGQAKPTEAPQTEIIESPQAGPGRRQRIRDLGSRIPLGKFSARFFSPILRRINPILNRYKEIILPAAVGAAIGAATGGAPTAVLYGLFGGAMGAGVIKPIVDGGRRDTEEASEAPSNSEPQQESPPAQEEASSAPQENNAPQRRTPPPPPPSPASNALADTARFAMSFPGGRTWMIIGLIGLAIVIWITMQAASEGGAGSSGGAPAPSPTTGTSSTQVSVIKAQQDCKSEKDYCVVANGSDITYVITVNYLGQGAATVEVDDPLPPKITFKNAPGGENQGGTVKWVLNNMTPNQPKNLTLTITPGSDVWVVNKATATVNQAPNNNTCGDKYTLTNHESGAKNPLGNFGDPSCNYTQQQLYELLKQNDPANADFWYNAVVKCESGYDPTDWRDPTLVPHTPDSHGAFGLFQMGMGDSSNGPLDNGAVNWTQQITNAVGYKNQKLGGNFGYWACAK